MVAINTQNPVMQRLRERAERHKRTTPGVRVEPTSDLWRRLMRHPKAGSFRSEGSMEWPNDVFTKKRLRAGVAVRLAEGEPEHQEAPVHSRSASRRPE